jgi:hypothetical protein
MAAAFRAFAEVVAALLGLPVIVETSEYARVEEKKGGAH